MKKSISIFGAIIFASLILTNCGSGSNNIEKNSKDSTTIKSDSIKKVAVTKLEKNIIKI